MASSGTRRKLTYDDFVTFPDDGQRHELIDGEHYVTPSPNTRHQRLVVRLTFELELYLRSHPIGELFGAPFDCVFTDVDVVEPDLLLVLDDQRDILTPKNIQGAPALVVEILSSSTVRRDLGIKRDLYDRGGVREYWVIDPDANVIRINRRAAGARLAEEVTLHAEQSEVLTSPLMPGFSLALKDFFRSEPVTASSAGPAS